jgi:uncharacterized protein (TIGR03067 family)
VTRCALLVLTASLLLAAAPKEDPAREDLKKLEGNWVLAAGIDEGTKLSAETLKGARLTFKGDHHTVVLGDNTYKGTHKLDATKKPKTIDINDTEGPFKGKTVYGIYEVTADEFRICLAVPGKDRPKNFTSKEGSGHHLHTWKRAKK